MAEFEITLAEIGEYVDFMAHQGEDGEMPMSTTVFELTEVHDQPIIEIANGS